VKQDSRPINVSVTDLAVFKWPIMAIASIPHRVSGALLFFGVGFMLFALDMSLSSEAGFETMKSLMATPVGMFVTWVLLSCLAYHFVAGFKHLAMDMGIAETLEGAQIASATTLFLSAILIGLAALWVIWGGF
jgi:succinate dehydrogenase / fumarate reductase, cytochrome b subunit